MAETGFLSQPEHLRRNPSDGRAGGYPTPDTRAVRLFLLVVAQVLVGLWRSRRCQTRFLVRVDGAALVLEAAGGQEMAFPDSWSRSVLFKDLALGSLISRYPDLAEEGHWEAGPWRKAVPRWPFESVS